MDALILAVAVVISYVGTYFCWRRIHASEDWVVFKVAFYIIAAIPLVGPFMYRFADMPRFAPAPGEPDKPKPPSAVLRRWNEREHIYLTWAALAFTALAVLAWWINDWSPGRIHVGPTGVYTDLDATFYTLLVLAILAWGAALRAKVALTRILDEQQRMAAQAQR